MNSYFDYSFSIDDQIVSRICEEILPQIHEHVNKLIVEQNEIEYIKHAHTKCTTFDP